MTRNSSFISKVNYFVDSSKFLTSESFKFIHRALKKSLWTTSQGAKIGKFTARQTTRVRNFKKDGFYDF